jgi:hypothetical protein
MTQLAFTNTPDGLLEGAFWEFHHTNPAVYDTLRQLALQWRDRRGYDAPLGIKMLFERARWELSMTLTGDTPKLNNNHTAFYARLLMARNPTLAGMFHLRQQRVQATFGPDNSGLLPNIHVVPAGHP